MTHLKFIFVFYEEVLVVFSGGMIGAFKLFILDEEVILWNTNSPEGCMRNQCNEPGRLEGGR